MPRRLNIAIEILECIDTDADFLQRIIFTDEDTFSEHEDIGIIKSA